MTITVVPLEDGILTNRAGVRINGKEVTLDNNSAVAVTVVQGGGVSQPRLTLEPAQGGYRLHLSGQLGMNYVIQSSPDLLGWESVTNALGADWSMTLAIPIGANSSTRFYRAQVGGGP